MIHCSCVIKNLFAVYYSLFHSQNLQTMQSIAHYLQGIRAPWLTKHLYGVEIVVAVPAMPGRPPSTSTSRLAASRMLLVAAVFSFNIILLLLSIDQNIISAPTITVPPMPVEHMRKATLRCCSLSLWTCPHESGTVSMALEQFWSDAIPHANNDSKQVTA